MSQDTDVNFVQGQTIKLTPDHVSGAEIVKRALSVVLRGFYLLGAGDYKPFKLLDGHLYDQPFTHGGGCDCWGLAAYAMRRGRHNPGFNRGAGSKATVVDDENTDSAIEDALGPQTVYEVVPVGEERMGDLLVYHSVYESPDKSCHTTQAPGDKMVKMGHVAVLERVGTGPNGKPRWQDAMTRIVQCFGPNNRSPGVMSTGPIPFNTHDHEWAYYPGNKPRPDLATVVLRVKGALA